jgi:SWIM/SEC-C metal-binding protein
MSDKFFFKGRQPLRENHVKSGFTNQRTIKHGSAESPLTLSVTSAERQTEVEAILLEHGLHAQISLNPDEPENLNELDVLTSHKRHTKTVNKAPGRNDPCSCGSGKKYKKCCA